MTKVGTVELGKFPLLLAPMEDVTDPGFRAICKEQGADLMYTEFVAAEGVIRGIERSIKKLEIYEHEKPIGIQIFGENIDSMRSAAAIVEEAQPELIDINYGCPVKKVAKRGAGAGILLDLPKMQAMTAAIVKQVKLPVTVKTRLGWDANTIKIIEVAKRLQDAGIQALTIHGRTREQMYRGIANWEYIAAVKNHPEIHIPIFGNGDIDSPQKALLYKQKYNVDGMMIGRAAIGNPWIFREIKHYVATGELLPPPSCSVRVETIKRHLKHSMVWKGDKRGLLEMRGNYAKYLRGLPGIKPFRIRLVQADTAVEIHQILNEMQNAI